jgi:hypothetical protein
MNEPRTRTKYTYDGDGRRVSKVGSKLYWYGTGDDILAETDADLPPSSAHRIIRHPDLLNS